MSGKKKPTTKPMAAKKAPVVKKKVVKKSTTAKPASKKVVAKPASKKVVAKPASKKVVAKPSVKKTHTGKVTCTKSVSGVEYFFVEGKRVSKASLTAEQIKNCVRNVSASKTKAKASKSKKAPKRSTKASPFSNYTIRDSPVMRSAKISIPPSPRSSSSKVSSNVISKDNVIFLNPNEKYFVWGSKFEREPVYTFSGEEIQALHMSIANAFSNTGQFPMVLSKAQHNLLKKDQSLAPAFKSAKIPSLLSLVEEDTDDEDYEDAEGWSDVEDV